MNRSRYIARILVVLMPLLALIPIGRMVADWVEVSRMISAPSMQATARGYDWVVWQERDGLITAAYVFPQGPAAEAGLEEGDVFYLLEYQQYFNVEDLQRAIEGIAPGSVRTYTVQRGDSYHEIRLPFLRYPTFLYPLSSSLWRFSIWGFIFGTFFHVIGLVIAVPLAWRSRRARFSLLLIAVSMLWMGGNLLRLLLVDILGPPGTGSLTDGLFQALTLVGLVGWIGFPALLLSKVIVDADLNDGRLASYSWGLVWLPPILLGGTALATTVGGSVGPFTLDSLIAPILFYACCYIAAAAAVVLALYLAQPGKATERVGGWSRGGSVAMIVVAAMLGLSILGVVPIFGVVTDTTAGWVVVSAQLLSIVPVIFVSLATLKYGKVSHVFSRALTYLTVLGLIFFAFVGGMSLISPYLERVGASPWVMAGLYVVLLLIVFERLARSVRSYTAQFFATDAQRTRRRLNQLLDQMRTIFDFESLAHHTVEAIGEAFRARSARLFLRPSAPSGPWISSAYHPEPPYITERNVDLIWPHVKRDGAIWARNAELNETNLPPNVARLLKERNAALAMPILGEERAIGLLVLGMKKRRGAVYNLEDLELLRSLSGQLALAIERLNLVERERVLVRETAEAELVALRAQINPHFLFNALNTIIALIEEHPEEAVQTVEHLSAIFRHILQTGSRSFVSIDEEFTLVAHYLSIEQARFGARLEVEQQIEDDLGSYPVPAFAVQTIAENAVKHGLEKRRGGGAIWLSCRRRDNHVAEVVVSDTGVGIPALFGQEEQAMADASFFGIGLRNVAARLEQLYGRNDLLRIQSDPEKGTTVRLLLPDANERQGQGKRTLTLKPVLSEEN